jgi:hypothetical protein
MAKVETIEIYNALKDRLGEEQTRLLLKYIEEASRANVATKEDLLTTESGLVAEIAKVREDMGKLETALRREMAQMEIRLREDLHKLRDELKSEDFKIKTILYVLIVLLLITNPKLVELLGRVLGIIK